MSITNVNLTSKSTGAITLTDAAVSTVADSEVADDDVVNTFGEVKVVVDPASAELLSGASLDFSDGLQGAGFHITNPNATRTCGCGNSFS
jgi:iron-sulfur cluster assembly accessory protein